MKLDVVSLYQDYGIDFVTEGHKHTQPGWVNVECPFCTGNPGYHLGFNTYDGYFHCWRCGGHQIIPTLKALLNLTGSKALHVFNEYADITITTPEPQVKIRRKQFRYPSNISQHLFEPHMQYLAARGFDAEKIGREWNLMATGPISHLDKIDFKYRIIAPIYWDGIAVSFQSRDVTNRSKLKYITCPQSRELLHHKNIIYRKQNTWDETEVGICVEGITDVWRFGSNAFATFGIKFTETQLKLIAKLYKKVFVIFDADAQAKNQAIKLVEDLQLRNVQAERIVVSNDPASLKQTEADYLTKQLIK